MFHDCSTTRRIARAVQSATYASAVKENIRISIELDKLNNRYSGLAYASGMLVFAGAIFVERVFAGARFDQFDAVIAACILLPQFVLLSKPVLRQFEEGARSALSGAIVVSNGLMLVAFCVRHTRSTDGLPYMLEMVLIQTVFAYIFSGLSLRAAVTAGAAMWGALLLGLFWMVDLSPSALARTALVITALNIVGLMGRLWTTALARHYDRVRQELDYEASHDPLTGTLNRRGIQATLDRVLKHAYRERLPVGVLYLDLDGFKRINDDISHAAGDAMLATIANLLKDASRRPLDAVARMGGDEFLVIWPTAESGKLLAHTQRLAQAIAHSRQVSDGGREFGVTASIGVFVAQPGSQMWSAEAVVTAAERLAMTAKAAGGDRIEFSGAGPQAALSLTHGAA